jgi:hypothetical protein
VSEARINEGTEHLIEQNRGEFDGLLGRAMQPPPQKVCAGSVYIEHVITYVFPGITSLYQRFSLLQYASLLSYTYVCFRLLEREYERHKSVGNTDTALKLHDVGVTLFYHIITLYNDESAFYPPSKQLLTTCIENLGQVSIMCFKMDD